MPQTKRQAQRVDAMVESRSLVSETKRGASRAIEVGALVAACVRFEKTDVVGVSTSARLKSRLLPSMPGWMEILNGASFACLGTIRNEFEVALPAATQIPKRRAGVGFANAGGLVSLRSQMQSMPSLFQLAAKIVWPVPSFTRAGITSRSSGLASPAA